MERNIQKHGLINLLAILVIGVAAFIVARAGNSLAGQVCSVFLGIGVLVAAVSWFQMRLEERERLEKLELEEISKSRGSAALFEAKDADIFPAQRSREQFERFFVPGFTIVLFLLQAVGAWLLWRWLPQIKLAPELFQPQVSLSLFALFAFLLFLLGRFSATIARIGNHRLLRPGASYLLLGAYLCALVALGIAGLWIEFPKADYYVAHVLVGLLAVVALETLIQLVLEIYRPRLKGKVERPLYESRLVGLLGQPEGLITTAAQALDYQFGFKVSETWFYRFFARAISWLLLLQGGVLILSTAVVFIEAGEQGLLEHFGNPVQGHTLLDPGIHFKWPWPIDKVYRYRTEQIQSFDVGLSPESGKEEVAILWTVAHSKEDNFLVANREPVRADSSADTNTNNPTSKPTPPVSLLTGSIPVQFQITNLLDWAYRNEDAPALMADLGTREVVRYLSSVDLNDILSSGRMEAAQALRDSMQKAADDHQLGARIISVGLQDLHPPVKVAPDYENVVKSIHTNQIRMLDAQAHDIRTNNLAAAQARSLLNKAQADRLEREVRAKAQAALFTNQIPAFEAAPSVYAQRAYLQTFVRATANARKYVVLTTNTHEVIQFDLQDKVREDILTDVSIAAPKK